MVTAASIGGIQFYCPCSSNKAVRILILEKNISFCGEKKKKSKEKNWGQNGTGRRERKMGFKMFCNLFYMGFGP